MRTVSGSADTSSVSPTQISPEIFAAPALCKPMIDRLVTLLPEPDSPTMPSRLPRSSWNDRPSTDLTTPSSVGKCTRRSRTSRNDRFSCSGAGTSPASTSSALMAPPRENDVDAAHPNLTLGSITAYRRSTTRFASTMKMLPSSTTPSTFGRSLLTIASTEYLPIPGSE